MSLSRHIQDTNLPASYLSCGPQKKSLQTLTAPKHFAIAALFNNKEASARTTNTTTSTRTEAGTQNRTKTKTTATTKNKSNQPSKRSQ